ncbi:MAG: hypothetical protein ABI721_04940 [Candidatus Dojkabacteria bacterium]
MNFFTRNIIPGCVSILISLVLSVCIGVVYWQFSVASTSALKDQSGVGAYGFAMICLIICLLPVVMIGMNVLITLFFFKNEKKLLPVNILVSIVLAFILLICSGVTIVGYSIVSGSYLQRSAEGTCHGLDCFRGIYTRDY